MFTLLSIIGKMKANHDKTSFWFDPKEHGGLGNMRIYWLSIGAAALAIVVKLIINLLWLN